MWTNGHFLELLLRIRILGSKAVGSGSGTTLELHVAKKRVKKQSDYRILLLNKMDYVVQLSQNMYRNCKLVRFA
jgi:hypothetical protein